MNARRLRRLALWATAIAVAWITAVSALDAALALSPVTPGDRPDHLE
jgi:hypothetical protein